MDRILVIALHVSIFGSVQGVGFRRWMNESALKLSLTGWVRNASDGSVEAFIQGPQDNVNDMLSSLWEGPNLADVEDVLTQDSQVDESLELFNRQAKTTTIPGQLAKKYGCRIVPVYIERVKKFYFKLHFYKPLKFDDKLSIEQISLELNKILEKMILKNPDQWIWSHNRWK